MHFYISIRRFTKSGNVFGVQSQGETYKLLSAYPPSPHDDDRGPHLYPQGVSRFESHPLRTMMIEVPTCTRRGYAGSNPPQVAGGPTLSAG